MESSSSKYITRSQWRTLVHEVNWEMLALDVQSFSLINDVSFSCLLHLAFPQYTVPLHTIFSWCTVLSLFEACREMVKAALAIAEVRALHFTSDIWISMPTYH